MIKVVFFNVRIGTDEHVVVYHGVRETDVTVDDHGYLWVHRRNEFDGRYAIACHRSWDYYVGQPDDPDTAVARKVA